MRGISTLSRSWKKTPTAFQVSVSKLYVTSFCGAAATLKAKVTLCWGSCITRRQTQTGVPASHDVRHRHIQQDSPALATSQSHRPLPTQHATPKTNDLALKGFCTRDTRNETSTELHIRPCSQQFRSSHIHFVTASVVTH